MISLCQNLKEFDEAERKEAAIHKLADDLMSGEIVKTGAKTEITFIDVMDEAMWHRDMQDKHNAAMLAVMRGEPNADKALKDIYESVAIDIVRENFDAWVEWQAEI